MQIRHNHTVSAEQADAMKCGQAPAPARLTLVSNDRQNQPAATRNTPSREEAVRAAMLRTG